MQGDHCSRRAFLAGTAAAGASLLVGWEAPGAGEKKTFTILHTNDLHSNLIGFAPASDYTPFTPNDDGTRGGFARLATVIEKRRAARKGRGPVLLLDAGDLTTGTAFAAAFRETGGELQLLSRMGYDAITPGNHEFDLGPDALGDAIGVAVKAGRMPVMVASNTDFGAQDPTLAGLQRLGRDGVIRRHLVIDREGIRFGIFGVLGKEALFYASGAGAVSFPDAIETAREVVKVLRERERVDVVICLSHGGVMKGEDGRFTEGDDIRLARAVPGIDVVIGAHSHTELHEPILVGERTTVVQAGKWGAHLGELVMTLDRGRLGVESYRLHPVDDTIVGDRAIAAEVDGFTRAVTDVVFASRGYRIDQPLVVVSGDVPNTFRDVAASTLLANLVTDAFRRATGADIGFTAGGMIRAGLTRGRSGVQTVYDVFAVAPFGAGVLDTTAGGTLVTGWLTGRELKHLLEFMLMDRPSHPGEYFPRASGMRFTYDPSRPQFERVMAIELGDRDGGYRALDTSAHDERLYSVTCPLYLGTIIVGIPGFTKGRLALVPKNREGQPLASKADALDLPRGSTPDLLPPHGTVDRGSVATETRNGAVREIKEWQAIMDHLRTLPKDATQDLPVIRVSEQAAEVRAIRMQ